MFFNMCSMCAIRNNDVLTMREHNKYRFRYVVALNASLVLWVASIEDDLNEGFKKALSIINKGNPWKNFLLLKTYLSSDELI